MDSLASARIAAENGASRLELCSCLIVGGLTPDPALLRQVRQAVSIPIRCLIRPRFGDFCYTEEEISLMEDQITVLRECGADGFVIGCLTPDGDLDEAQMQRLIRAAGGRGLTLHRAFDVSRDAVAALHDAVRLGIDTVLTSGQAASCREGRACIETLLAQNLPIEIMPGGGVDAAVIQELTAQYPLRTFHMSGKTVLSSRMRFRRQNVPMGLPGLDEFSIWQTDPKKISDAVQALFPSLSREIQVFSRQAWADARVHLGDIVPELEMQLARLYGDRRTLMELALATLPASDVASVPFSVLLEYADCALELRKGSPFCRDIPEDIFLHHVFYPRVNSEDLVACRRFFASHLLPLVQDLPAQEAVLTVNRWCAAQLTYETTDNRSQNPITCYLCGLGRCGEESTFAVTAFRSVGIPARQIYVPWWSHCDDNHAWVEVYAGGAWHFLGACEPEPILDRGWFSGASSRAMLALCRNYFDFIGDGLAGEPCVQIAGICRMYNVIGRYAKTAVLTVTVLDSAGTPQPDATVQLSVLNMAAPCAIARWKTDGQGRMSITLGLGSVLVTAQSGDRFGRQLVTLTQDSACTICADRQSPADGQADYRFLAPAAGNQNKTTLTPTQRAEKAHVLRQANRQRLDRIAQYWKPEMVTGDPDFDWIFRHAAGNAEPLWRFWINLEEADRPMAKAMLLSLATKDYRDCKPSVLQAHLQAGKTLPGRDTPEFIPYVLCPRIGLELLEDWRTPIFAALTKQQADRFRADPPALWAWITEQFPEGGCRYHPVLSLLPSAALKLRAADAKGRRILFVAILRTLGVPARLSPVDGRAEYFDGRFHTVEADSPREQQGTVQMAAPSGLCYHQSWTLARYQSGWQTLDLSDSPGPWSLPVGQYRLTAVTRLPSGSQLARETTFHLAEGETVCLTVQPPEAAPEQLMADFQIELPPMWDEQERPWPLPTGRSLLVYLEIGTEPTEHILNELLEQRERVRQALSQGLHLILLLPDTRQNDTFRRVLAALPDAITVRGSVFQPEADDLARSLYQEPGVTPLAVLTDGKTGFFGRSGYAVGTVDLVLRLWDALHNMRKD